MPTFDALSFAPLLSGLVGWLIGYRLKNGRIAMPVNFAAGLVGGLVFGAGIASWLNWPSVVTLLTIVVFAAAFVFIINHWFTKTELQSLLGHEEKGWSHTTLLILTICTLLLPAVGFVAGLIGRVGYNDVFVKRQGTYLLILSILVVASLAFLSEVGFPY